MTTTHQLGFAEMTDLRERARRILRDHTFDETMDAFEQGNLDLERLLEELHIYHAELYIQQQALNDSRHITERALARFTRLYRELPFPVLLINAQGHLKEGNAAAQRLLPFDCRLFIHLAVEGQTRVLENALLDSRRAGRADCREVRLRGQGNSIVTADLRLIRLPEIDGDEAEIVCNLVDQTEQVAQREDLVAANRRLRIQEERYHVVADFAPDWAYWMGEDGRFRYVSPACARITGYPAAAFLKDPELLSRIIHPDDRDGYLMHLHGAHATHRFKPMRFRLYTRTGELRWIEHLCVPVTGDGGRPLGHRGSNLDVTEKVRLETALGMASEVIDASSTIAFHWAPEPGWPVIYASPNVRRWGYALEQLLSRRLSYLDVVHPQDCVRVVAAFETFIQEKRDVFRQTYRVCWADGSEHWVDEETRGVFGPDGRLLYFHGIVTDVTEREQAERGLKRQLDLQALVARISSRLIDVTGDTLEQTIDWSLERIGRSLGADRSYLLRLSNDHKRMDMTHEWCAEDIRAVIDECQALSLEHYRWWAERLAERDPVLIADVSALPAEATAERTELERQGVRSIVTVPMTRHGRVWGALGLDAMTRPRSWSNDTVQMLQVIGEVIAGALLRTESEVRLTASENLYRHVTDMMSDVAYSCVERPGEGFRIDWMTDSVEALTRYTLAEVREMGCWSRLLIDEDVGIFNDKVAGLAPGARADCELRLRRKDGAIRWLRATTECVAEDADPTQRRLYGGLLDITEHKSREAEIERLALVVEQSPSIVLITDIAGAIEYVNARFCESTGYRPQEILGRSVDTLRSATRTADENSEIWSALQRGEVWTGEFQVRKKSGETYWEYAHITPLRNEQGLVTHYVKLAEDISDRKALSQQVSYLARYDPLTGLPNRTLMRERVEQALIAASHADRVLALLSIDLDDLRSVNDSLGHPAGDELLRAVAERWQPLLRDEDTLARFSGDNFIALATGLRRAEDASRLADRIRDALAQPIILGEQGVVVSCSIGIALYPDDSSTAEELISHADTALHGAKIEGRGLHRFFTSALNDDLQEQFRTEQALRRAIERHELLLYYQPRVDIVTGRILGLEALVRWDHPELGLIPPGRFIPVAESSGLILLVGPIVVRLVCEQIAAWRNAGVALVPVAFNLSATELYQEGLAGRISTIAAEVGVDPDLLEIEVTESTAMRSIEQAVEVLSELRDRGFTLAIDDFGTGFASLSYLNRLPVQTIKIDRSFLAEIGSGGPGESQAETIVKAIIGLGANLGLQVIAEGVETEAQNTFLINHGCREAQGYLFCRPGPADRIEALLRGGIVEPGAEPID
ncbi:EAL domain-containing protein [Thiocapsa roseopersicina]|uniref:PAS domain S-box-containing protein/diguanylate cyclase (GGDEF) domain-containing protein n=1 Tax=Thiocapsa roseopersicina TaxID=1058 RepID=A0A1H2WS81_THIRO|nr:EAL domain-containing protein [Thiocapsa roseopersicina]SDW83368.1 PAS domain S-box-containing protein/diguanylate cyclase (GGDEF) domain-containing protein [Thiocapsa roseopersicina]